MGRGERGVENLVPPAAYLRIWHARPREGLQYSILDVLCTNLAQPTETGFLMLAIVALFATAFRHAMGAEQWKPT